METRLVVDKKNNLQELRPSQSKYPAAIRLAARIISYIFHPLFIPVYISWMIFRIQSPVFSALNETGRNFYIPRFFLLYTFFPLISVLLLKAVGFISSIHLENKRDRIVVVSLAIFLASIGGLMANIYMKVSMHAIAAGVMAAFVMLLGFSEDLSFGIYISIVLFLTGIICTARFVDSDHTAKEIYVGLLVGILSLVIAMKFS
jgi:hypothetical protein